MSVLFVPVLVIHVVIAVLGLGSILSIAVLATTARRTGWASSDISAWLGPLLRYSAFSLAVMLATGILMDVVVGGSLHEWWWFRGSALLLVLTGILHGRARRAIRRELVHADARDAVLRRVERLAYGMCALVAAITILMEVKPF